MTLSCFPPASSGSLTVLVPYSTCMIDAIHSDQCYFGPHLFFSPGAQATAFADYSRPGTVYVIRRRV